MTGPSSQPDDPLEILRGHLRSAQEAAQQLLSQASETPPRGWEPSPSPDQARHTAGALHGLSELLGAVREVLPEDVLAELMQLIRQLVAVLRALVDVLLSRISATERPPSAEVQDIPII